MNPIKGPVYVGHVFPRDPQERQLAETIVCVISRDLGGLKDATTTIDPDKVLLWLYWCVTDYGTATPIALCDAEGMPAFICEGNFIDLIPDHYSDVALCASVSGRFSLLESEVNHE